MAKTIDRPLYVGVPPRRKVPEFQGYALLVAACVAVPIVGGLDKFLHLLAAWPAFVSPLVPRLLGVTPEGFSKFVGLVEIGAGVLTIFNPRVGSFCVGLLYAGTVVNLLTIPGHLHVAMQDVGLALAAFATWRLSYDFRIDRPLGGP